MQFTLETKGHGDFHDITEKIQEALRATGVRTGVVCAFVGGTTVGMTIIDDEEGHKEDIRRAFEKVAPVGGHYEHDTPGDRNGFAHVRCALMGCSVSIPVIDGELALGMWQKVFIADFDSRPRQRPVTIVVTQGCQD